MMNLFWLLLLSWTIGLMILYAINYRKNREDIWEMVGQCIARLVIGAVICIVLAVAGRWPWLLFTLPGAAALLSNHWLPWVIKKLR